MYQRSLDITGQTFGRLTAIRPNGKQGKHVLWLCRCDCGNEKTARSGNLKSGGVTSCGCARGHEELTGRRFGPFSVNGRDGSDKHTRAVLWAVVCDCGHHRKMRQCDLRARIGTTCNCLEKHGMSDSPEYRAWVAMIQRCHNPASPKYEDYGGRGITVCNEWRESFTAFLLHIGPKPSPELSVDRVENDGGYEPGNVRWTTRLIQNNNTRKTKNGAASTPVPRSRNK